ncbi:fimbrial biogenesis chaperone [Sphingomonas sp. CFBP 8765]|uniref:fimbrial biogenesis chaperone n=2 Tax=Sphingomonas TaxID=13687 RepID=UPI001A7EF377|nr:fimbria/pilus periplasmic chaperone [Sphingomonas sp. CFBP 8765]
MSLLQTGRLTAAGLCMAAAIALPGDAVASNFRVSPVTLTLPANRPVGSLTITNGEAVPVSIRVSAFRWTQVDGKDVYTPTDDLIASPPIFTAATRAPQLVRIGVRHRLPNAAYRVMLQEIPGPATANGVRIAVKLNLPLYIVADPTAKADVAWTAWRRPAGDIVLEARNTGGAIAQVTGIAHRAGTGTGGTSTVLSNAMGVVLPESMRQWEIGKHPELTTGTPLTLAIRTADGEHEVTANLAAR